MEKKKRENDSGGPPKKKRKNNPKKRSVKKVVNNLPIYSPDKAVVLVLGDNIQVGTGSHDMPFSIPCVVAVRRKKPREASQAKTTNQGKTKIRDTKLANLAEATRVKLPKKQGGKFFETVKGERIFEEADCLVAEKKSSRNFFSPDSEKNYVFGKQALNLDPSSIGKEWDIYYPFKNGCLNLEELTLHQAKYRLRLLLEHVLFKKLGLSPRGLLNYGVAVCVPVHWERGFLVEISRLLLYEIGFGGIFYHHAPVLTTFGYLLTSACVVSIENDISQIACIVEGQVVRKSFRLLPFGKKHILSLLDHLLFKNEFFIPKVLLESSPNDLRKKRALEAIYNQTCQLVQKKESGKYKHQNAEFSWPESEIPTKKNFIVSVGSASYIAPLGYFDTDLVWAFIEPPNLKRFKEINESHVFNQYHLRLAKAKVKGADDYENFIKRDELFSTTKVASPLASFNQIATQKPQSLDRAICSAICDVIPKYRPELAQSILVAGEAFLTPGVTKLLQARVTHVLPKLDQSIKKVEILRPRSATPVLATWKGLARVCLSVGSRDLWISRDAFLNTVENHNFMRNVTPFHFHDSS